MSIKLLITNCVFAGWLTAQCVTKMGVNFMIPESQLPSHPSDDDDFEEDGRSPWAIGYMWSVVIMSLGIELVLPILLGVYLDSKFGTVCLFLIFGVFTGFFVAIVNFIKLMKTKGFHQMGKKTRDKE